MKIIFSRQRNNRLIYEALNQFSAYLNLQRMEKNELSAKMKPLFAELDEVLADHKGCVDDCKSGYEKCMNGCGNQICARKCRSALEECINACPSFTLEAGKKERLAGILDRIEAALAG